MTVVPGTTTAGRTASRAWARLRSSALTASLAVILGGALALLSASCISASVEAGSTPGSLDRYGWKLNWVNTTGSLPDGTAFYNATYKGIPVFADYRIPFSYVDYTPGIPPYRDIVDQLGVIAWDGRTPTFRGCSQAPVKDRPVPGVLITCQYVFDIPGYEWEETPENEQYPNCATYRYTQHLYLYADGAFRPAITTWGPGYRNPHGYLVSLRMDMGVGRNGQKGDHAWVFPKSNWQRVNKEGDFAGKGGDPDGVKFAVRSAPSAGLPNVTMKAGRSDSSSVYFLRSSGDSFDGNRWASTPDEFDNDESLAGGQDLYVWYRGVVADPGCSVVASVIGPLIMRSTGYK